MAQIGGVDILVIREEETRNTETTDKPVEQGSDITDHTKNNPLKINLTCQLTDKNSKRQLDQLKKMRDERKLVTYRGKSSHSGLLVTNIQSIGTNTNIDGFALDITLTKPRIAKLATYKVKVKNPETKKQDAKTSTKVKSQTNIGQQPKQSVPMYSKSVQNAKKRNETPARNQLLLKRMTAYNDYRLRTALPTARFHGERAGKMKDLQAKQISSIQERAGNFLNGNN